MKRRLFWLVPLVAVLLLVFLPETESGAWALNDEQLTYQAVAW
jgi:hypothetical protein